MKIIVFPNLGNTCYFNSVLQCFIYNQEFQDNLNEKELSMELKKIKFDLTPDNNYLAILYNIKPLLSFFPFRQYEQQDAHEFIILFIDYLVKENKNYLPLYHGETKTTNKCLCCKNTKCILEEFNTLNFTVPNTKSNLTDLFINYLEKETISDPENLYYCEICKSNQPFEKKITLNKLPNVLIIVLKRYTSNLKINSEVIFDESLKIKMESIKEFKLTGLINHTGNLYDGHYTNYININDNWLFIDDHSVKIQKYEHQDAYILFYQVSS